MNATDAVQHLKDSAGERSRLGIDQDEKLVENTLSLPSLGFVLNVYGARKTEGSGCSGSGKQIRSD